MLTRIAAMIATASGTRDTKTNISGLLTPKVIPEMHTGQKNCSRSR